MDSSNDDDDDNNVNNINKELSNMSINNRRGKNCLYCLEEVATSLRCSKCRTALYCGKACQIKHWPMHKINCINSNAEDSDEKLMTKAENHSSQGNFINNNIMHY